jgi:hypothetical protein
MSREDLSAMLMELADEVQPRPQAERAWAKARQVRRRRAGIGAAVSVLLISTTIAIGQLAGSSPSPTANPSPTWTETTVGKARIDRLPPRIDPDRTLSAGWPPSLDPPADAATLQATPLSHAVLLFQPEHAGPIFAYGEGSINGGSGNGKFHWVRLDVNLTDTEDVGGNRAAPLDRGSLGPLGLHAAFAQPNEVVIVDLRDGTVQRIPLPGLNEEVTWFPNGRNLLVSTGTKTWLVSLTEVIGEVAANGFDVAALVGDGTGLTTLAMPDSQPPVIRRYDDPGRTEFGHTTLDLVGADPYHISYLAPRSWRMGSLIATAASGQVDNRPGDFVMVVDAQTGAVTNVLDLGDPRVKGCCTVMGWQTSDVVLVRTEGDLLVWRLSTGLVTQLADNVPGSISVAPTGCGWRITIDGVTSACTT